MCILEYVAVGFLGWSGGRHGYTCRPSKHKAHKLTPKLVVTQM